MMAIYLVVGDKKLKLTPKAARLLCRGIACVVSEAYWNTRYEESVYHKVARFLKDTKVMED